VTRRCGSLLLAFRREAPDLRPYGAVVVDVLSPYAYGDVVELEEYGAVVVVLAPYEYDDVVGVEEYGGVVVVLEPYEYGAVVGVEE